MKKLILLVALVGCWGIASAQLWENNGGALENTTSGAVNVGGNNGDGGANIQIGDGRSANGNALFDLVADVDQYSDFGVRLIRYGKGALQGISRFAHRGNKALEFKASDNGAISFTRQGDAISLYINGSGQVGIGTSEPGSFDLAVDGMVGSREVQVTATSPFPDYVFADTYELMSLKTLKNYIEENNHLPNIPSAAEVEAKGGFMLGEMNLKLLEKVEELTLYIIDQNERIEALEAQLQKIKENE